MGDDPTEITSEEFAAWLVPKAAVELLSHLPSSDAAREIVTRLQHGLISAAAETVSLSGGKRKVALGLIRQSVWTDTDEYFPHHRFWQSGDVTLRHITEQGRTFDVGYFGVRFNHVQLQAMVPISPKAVPPVPGETGTPLISALSAAVLQNRRGRPPKEWWDDLWVEMCRKIYVEGFLPKTQAEIERAMLDWATSSGHEMGEATAKRVARKLFPVFKE